MKKNLIYAVLIFIIEALLVFLMKYTPELLHFTLLASLVMGIVAVLAYYFIGHFANSGKRAVHRKPVAKKRLLPAFLLAYLIVVLLEWLFQDGQDLREIFITPLIMLIPLFAGIFAYSKN